MTRVYACAVFCSSGLWLDQARLRLIAGDLRTGPWSHHVERSYERAIATLFNAYYGRSIEVRHVLSSRLRVDGLDGEAWSDWTLLRNRRLGTASLHLAFTFPGLRLDLQNPHCPITEAVAAFLSAVYRLSEDESHLSPGMAELSRLLSARARQRQHALGVSRYMFVSLLSDGRGDVTEPSPAAQVNFYRLLFQHARGVDAATAASRLPAAWRSTSFFKLYSQPGGMLSIANAYPQPRGESAWFDPAPPAVGRLAGASGEGAYASYDLLPEYPPLRYLGLLAIEYAAAYEETLRGVYESAFGATGPWLRAPWRAKPEVRHLLAANLEGIRLPVMRELVHGMLEVQLQERTARGAVERLRMREGRRTAVLTVLGIVVAILFADHEKALKAGKAVVDVMGGTARPTGK